MEEIKKGQTWYNGIMKIKLIEKTKDGNSWLYSSKEQKGFGKIDEANLVKWYKIITT